MSVKQEESPQSQSNRHFYEIGYVGDQRYFCGEAVAHRSGWLTDERLTRMDDAQLQKLAYQGDSVAVEEYHSHDDRTHRNVIEILPHRAYFTLKFRRDFRNHRLDADNRNHTPELCGAVEPGMAGLMGVLEASGIVPAADRSKELAKSLLTGLKRFCDENPESRNPRMVYAAKLAHYKSKYAPRQHPDG